MSAGIPSARVGADVGGTFTDIILEKGDGTFAFIKVLSTPPNYDRAVVAGISTLCTEAELDITEVVHGTTLATNAVIERKGARTALVTTAGFRDVLELRRVRMPHLYDLFWDKPAPLVERHLRFEVGERMSAAGEVLTALDDDEVRQLAERLRHLDLGAIAVCFLHAHRHPKHEERVGAILRRELPGVAISLSSEVIREQQEYERSAATTVNAYVRPLMAEYVEKLAGDLLGITSEARLMIMQSSGGIMTAGDAAVRPVYALESGPAAGVVAARSLASELGYENVIAFDMGGTTAKASLVEGGRIVRSREYEVGAALSFGSRLLRGSGELIRIPTIDIAEVGAGGGSLAWLDAAGGLHVGPQSAGADPGPACYDRGGTAATVTDANVLLGYIPSGRLASGDLQVSRGSAQRVVEAVADQLNFTLAETALGIHRLANASMMRVLRAVSSEKGRDPRDFALMAYGGSGPIHAATLAGELGITTVLVPPVAGLFSATGLLFARQEFHDVRFCRIDAASGDVDEVRALDAEMRDGLRSLIGEGVALEWQRSADVRYNGQSWDIELDFDGEVTAESLASLAERFEQEHERTYGIRLDPGSPVELRALRVVVLGPKRSATGLRIDGDHALHPTPASSVRAADFGDGPVEVPVWKRSDVQSDPISGPVLIDEYDTTVVVPPGWDASRHATGTLVLTRRQADKAERRAFAADPVTQELVANGLASIADEMATTIFRTAHSTIVRDVMDFSAALCGPTGETIAQAVTIPLHLGSIPHAMSVLLAKYPDGMNAGDIFVMNDPFDGGIHTSDIYVVKPVFLRDELVGYAVSVAHHADVGGRVPGTTACDNTDVFQEGIRIPWLPLYRRGEPVTEVFELLRANVRIPRMTLGDLRAEVAACNVAERGIQDLAEKYGPAVLAEIMTGLIDHTERLVRTELATWPNGSASFTDYLDSDGLVTREVAITVDLTIRDGEVIVDLSRSSPMVQGALNCTHSFTEASVYVPILSALVTRIPNTAGAFRPITVVTQPGTIAHVVTPGASSMRGVTGFRIFDAVNGALAQLIPDRIPAAGEGGNTLAIFSGAAEGDSEEFVYYELVVGTWGGRPTADGNDGLSNPCAGVSNIPVEVAEADFPILVEHYGFVPDSGGAGQYRGGLALARRWRTLKPNIGLGVRSDRQVHRPYGLSGGAAGDASANFVTHDANGTVQPIPNENDSLPPMFSATMGVGSVYHHRMAGGGGWGDPFLRDPEAVARDVLNEKVSIHAAEEQYGVVLTSGGAPDSELTDAARKALRSARHAG